MGVVVRPVSTTDLPFLTAMAVAACHDPRAPIPANAEENPDVLRLVEGWGRPGDVGVIASTAEGERQGAAWCRVFPRPLAYALDGRPLAEVTIAVEERRRRKGVGSVLLGELVRLAAERGHTALTLKVSHHNPFARRLYERAGFTSFRTTERGVWMRLDPCSE
jgi:GNAT superfamily N-acetyltransferase